MRGDFYKQLTNDLETARAEGLFKKSALSRLRSRRTSPWQTEATSSTFAPTTIWGWLTIPN
ncbi:2-amino-3-ketobutyrate coenzyme A ligase [Citrobacter koseri]|nr:2-amino-3-ketobutyrate coenzyme A ligase [Citrobacter koseri]